MMTQNEEPAPVRTHQSFIPVTYVWVGNEYKGMFFYDATEGYLKLSAPWDEVYENEQQCLNKLLRGNPNEDE